MSTVQYAWQNKFNCYINKQKSKEQTCQQVFTCSKKTMESTEQCVKSIGYWYHVSSTVDIEQVNTNWTCTFQYCL